MSVWVLCICSEQPSGPAGEWGMCGTGGNGIKAGMLGRRNGHHSAPWMCMCFSTWRGDVRTALVTLASVSPRGRDMSALMPGASREDVALLKATPSPWLSVWQAVSVSSVWSCLCVFLWAMCSALLLAEPANRKAAAPPSLPQPGHRPGAWAVSWAQWPHRKVSGQSSSRTWSCS